MATESTHAMRAAELEQVIPLLPSGGKLLELGAGDGWQARVLQQLGFDVTAVDVEVTRRYLVQHFPVSLYDGIRLPFQDNSFDAIYSSNVLEHVVDFAQVQSELSRVLRPGGIAIHCVPSAVWRFWTTVGHPMYAARLAWSLRTVNNSCADPNHPTENQRLLIRGKSPFSLLRMGLISPRHGEHGNLFAEHRLFSRRGWARRFNETGWHVSSAIPTHLFYTGNELFGLSLTIRARQRLASTFGSSTLIYILRPPYHQPT